MMSPGQICRPSVLCWKSERLTRCMLCEPFGLCEPLCRISYAEHGCFGIFRESLTFLCDFYVNLLIGHACFPLCCTSYAVHGCFGIVCELLTFR